MKLSRDMQELWDALVQVDQLLSAARALIDSIDDNKIDAEHVERLRECLKME